MTLCFSGVFHKCLASLKQNKSKMAIKVMKADLIRFPYRELIRNLYIYLIPGYIEIKQTTYFIGVLFLYVFTEIIIIA